MKPFLTMDSCSLHGWSFYVLRVFSLAEKLKPLRLFGRVLFNSSLFVAAQQVVLLRSPHIVRKTTKRKMICPILDS